MERLYLVLQSQILELFEAGKVKEVTIERVSLKKWYPVFQIDDEQLGQIDAQGKRRKQHAQGQDVLALAPGQRQHEPDVLPDAVLWFCFHMWFTSFREYCSTKNRPRSILGTKRRFWGTNCRSNLRQQDLGGESAVLAVAADVAVQPLDDGVDPHQTETVPLALGGAEKPAHLLQLFAGAKAGDRDVELGVLHVHIDADQPL